MKEKSLVEEGLDEKSTMKERRRVEGRLLLKEGLGES